jgi:hypothetical protein
VIYTIRTMISTYILLFRWQNNRWTIISNKQNLSQAKNISHRYLRNLTWFWIKSWILLFRKNILSNLKSCIFARVIDEVIYRKYYIKPGTSNYTVNKIKYTWFYENCHFDYNDLKRYYAMYLKKYRQSANCN